jgi:hypothetical protein
MRLLVSLLFLIPLCAQPPQEAPKQGGGRPAPKNLKVLKVEGAQLLPLMQSYAAALGKRCDHCHMGRDFASDENPKKDIARQMIAMAQEINAKFPDGKEHVTCYTCHRGDVTPKTAPPPPAPAQ